MQYDDHPGRSPQRTWVNLPLMVALFIVVVLGIWLIYEKRGTGYDPEAEPREITPRGGLMEIEQTTNAIYEKVKNSVVYITTLAVLKRDIFRLNVMEIPQGSGSGFIWDRDGRIVTNFHVILRAVQSRQVIRVTLANQNDYDARVVGYDARVDLAVLQIDAPSDVLQPIPLDTSNDLSVGHMVFAIGNPFGYDQTLTTGVVSALDREITSIVGTKITGVIQTDASINPGNSGGPLLDSAGRLIGVNTSIATTENVRQSAGVGFAVPVDAVNIVVPQIIRGGRAGLGVTLFNDRQRRDFGYPEGALIWDVTPDSAADKAELRSARVLRQGRRQVLIADLVVGVDDIKIRSQAELMEVFGQYEVGDLVKITIIRDGEWYEADVKLQAVN